MVVVQVVASRQRRATTIYQPLFTSRTTPCSLLMWRRGADRDAALTAAEEMFGPLGGGVLILPSIDVTEVEWDALRDGARHRI